jgi:hypothetical protein
VSTAFTRCGAAVRPHLYVMCGCGPWGGCRSYSGPARHHQAQFDRLVVGYRDHRPIRRAKRQRGQSPGALCTGLDRKPPATASPAPLRAYEAWTMEQAKNRLQTGTPEEKKADLMPAAWFAAWSAAALATDPAGAKQTPPVVRTPTGSAQDTRDYWFAGKPLCGAVRDQGTDPGCAWRVGRPQRSRRAAGLQQAHQYPL